ncbi:unnamed protein product [Bursaphelenchus xylophilus]|uniref:(pine wood nematode) hypothetical protein n=1 Tax=Bursaphelenchus xylophilus TaxID=6326 RepID=A0A1I7RVL2_BURXY|nr:unnamed protein product [Bursaphelenchus xylophilus]CAG9081837.1 unnamed protein product [Bursaphelenchus xylophilus]
MAESLVSNSNIYDVIFFIVGAFGTFLGISVIVIVLTQSPESMRTYKRFIINYTIFDMLFAFTLGVLVKPDPLFPFSGAYINGFFKYLGEPGAVVSDVAIVNSAGYAMSTQCYCIMYRFAVLQTNPKYMDALLSWTTWIVAYLISFAVTGGTYFIFDKVQPPQKDIPAKIIQALANFPGIPLPEFEGQLLLYLDYNSQYSKYAGAFVFIGFLAAEAISIGCVFLILRQLETKKASFSKATYKLHRQLTVALGIQLSMPILFIITPVTYGIIMTYIQGPTNTLAGRLAIMYIDLYGASNSVVTLYFVKPYRMFIIQKIKSFASFVTCGNYQCQFSSSSPQSLMAYNLAGRLAIMYIDLYGASNPVVTFYFVKPYRIFIIQKFKSFASVVTCGKYGNSTEVISVMAAESTLVSYQS